MSAQEDLFADAVEERSSLDVAYLPACYRGRFTLETLVPQLPLEHKTCIMYGKELAVPRLECWFSDAGKPYRFGGRVEHPKPWPTVVLALRLAVKETTGLEFDSCFVNYYRDGSDTISWHADDDSWIGPEIASVSFGEARRFCMKRKDDASKKAEYLLGDGDLFVMHAGTQQKWLHSVPRQKGVSGPRLNLTFRQTVAG